MALHRYWSSSAASLGLDTVTQCLLRAKFNDDPLLGPNLMTGRGQIYATPTVGQVGRARTGVDPIQPVW